ncbi:MAG: protein-L-isoaspartate(D-aspartate) O-methyltransferase [Thioalkalispiraceae bacterium]|jgi:protein-L-isoaspartate(D-aspartate) O-methyltransferase
MVKRYLLSLSLILIAYGSSPTGVHAQSYFSERQQLVEQIKKDVNFTSFYLGKSELSPQVVQALESVPRHEFVPPEEKRFAYQNRPLPIGYGQTISQPYIVAIMTELLEPKATDKVLEVGTGSGYQAAILAEVVDKVYTIEIIEPLAEEADQRLQRLRYSNVHTRTGDGYYGWESEAPFDGIVVTAAASHIPPPLIAQLKPGGHMMIPVGSRFMTQQLLLVTKQEDGTIKTRQVVPVRFVPLTGKH